MLCAHNACRADNSGMNHVLDIAAQALIVTTLLRLSAEMWSSDNFRLVPVPGDARRSARRVPGSGR